MPMGAFNGLETYLERRRVGAFADWAVCAAMVLTCGFYQIEGVRLNFSHARYTPDLSFLPGFLKPASDLVLTYGMDLVRVALAGCLVLSLACIAFSNGALRRWRFAAGIAAFFLLPQAGLAFINGEVLYNGFWKFLYEFSLMLGDWPFQMLQRLLGKAEISVSVSTAALLLFGGTMFLFLLGYSFRVSRTVKNKK